MSHRPSGLPLLVQPAASYSGGRAIARRAQRQRAARSKIRPPCPYFGRFSHGRSGGAGRLAGAHPPVPSSRFSVFTNTTIVTGPPGGMLHSRLTTRRTSIGAQCSPFRPHCSRAGRPSCMDCSRAYASCSLLVALYQPWHVVLSVRPRTADVLAVGRRGVVVFGRAPLPQPADATASISPIAATNRGPDSTRSQYASAAALPAFRPEAAGPRPRNVTRAGPRRPSSLVLFRSVR